MNITNNPNLKPFRDYDEHNVIPLYAGSGAMNKGTFVTIVNTLSGNTNVLDNANTPATPFQTHNQSYGSLPAYMYGGKASVNWLIRPAASGEPVLGVLLYDIKDTNDFGEDLRTRPKYERSEKNIVLIGEGAPVLTKGLIKTNNYTGTATPGSGATITTGGKLLMQVYSQSTSIAYCTAGPDADGYATFKIDCA